MGYRIRHLAHYDAGSHQKALDAVATEVSRGGGVVIKHIEHSTSDAGKGPVYSTVIVTESR